MRWNFRRLIQSRVLEFPRVSAIFIIFLSQTNIFWPNFQYFQRWFFQNMLQKHKCYIFYALKPWKTCSTLNFALKNFFMTDLKKNSSEKSWKNMILEHFLTFWTIFLGKSDILRQKVLEKSEFSIFFRNFFFKRCAIQLGMPLSTFNHE